MHGTSRRWHRVSVLGAIAALAVLSAGCPEWFKKPVHPGYEEPVVLHEQIPGRDLRRSPPQIESMKVELLSSRNRAANAALRVQLAEGEAGLDRLVLRPDGQQVVLRDDGRGDDEKAGDRILSGRVQIDVEQLEANRRRLLDIVRQNPDRKAEVQVFDSRSVVARRPVRIRDTPLTRGTILDLSDFDLGIALAVNPAKSLLITNPQVIAHPSLTIDPCGPGGGPLPKWSFAYLMDEMYNNSIPGFSSSAFASQWVHQWAFVQTPNNVPVAARPQILPRIIQPWQAASGGAALNLRRAPFKLVAIVNRLDLADNPVYGGGNAGELRFVFGAVDLQNSCAPLPFTVIFEYGVPLSGCKKIRTWAQDWQALTGMDPTTAAFRQALLDLTEQVVARGKGGASKPNGSALNQLRTNENALNPIWELREFRLQTDHQLRMTTVAQNPDVGQNGSPNLANFINANAAPILNGTYVVPLSFPDPLNPFLGGAAPVPPAFWNAPGIGGADQRRHLLSLGTCNGCHRGETATPFLHIDPQTTPASLSAFLTGGPPVPSPVPGENPPSHSFNDLAARAQHLDAIANGQCIFFGFQPPELAPLRPLLPDLELGPDVEIPDGLAEWLSALPTLPRTRMVH